MALRLFEGFGVELEYMIVEEDTMKVLPVTDQVLKAFSGKFIDEIENGSISWSNELALHVIELKTNGPAKNLSDLAQEFSANVKQINELLKPFRGVLMPTAMHPFMDPFSEMVLWPHERNEIYEKYNSIFDCRGHGWANLQSVHLNLPFQGDEEFARLHAAIRVILPILPALAASSPIKDGRYSGLKDTRLEVYQSNQKRVPSIAGKVIPEQVFNKKDYEEKILQKNYKDIAPFDPDCILQDEWLNSRGAIARFQRNAIEIRVLDIQECPAADLAILKVVVSAIKDLTEERFCSLEEQKSWEVDPLYALLKNCIENAEEATIDNPAYLKLFGFREPSASAGILWQFISEKAEGLTENDKEVLHLIHREGTLSTRISHSLGKISNSEIPDQIQLLTVYRKLSECLQQNKLFYS